MKLRIVSDLHLNRQEYELPYMDDEDEQILILAGDIGRPDATIPFIARHQHRFHSYIYVPGNHEYFHNDYHNTNRTYEHVFDLWNKTSRRQGYFLNCNYTIIDNVRFIGATLWTDYHGQPASAEALRDTSTYTHMVDHRYGKPDPQYIAALYSDHVRFVGLKLGRRQASVDVVITHYPPTVASLVASRQDPTTGHHLDASYDTAFSPKDVFSHIQWMNDGPTFPKLWIHGHIHSSIDMEHQGTRIVCNAMGEKQYRNERYDPYFVVEV